MYSDWGWLLILVIFVWLGGLTFFIWQQNGFLRSLFPRNGERDIRKKFEEILKQIGDFSQDLDKLKDSLSRVELLRYNPYDETGGDQSFSLALLDDKGNGFVLTSLHARSGTRVFAKPVSLGKEVKYRLSEEEEKVVAGAMR